MKTVVDTSVWIDYLKFEVNPETAALQQLLTIAPDSVLVLNLVAFELYCGLRSAVCQRARLPRVIVAFNSGDRYRCYRFGYCRW